MRSPRSRHDGASTRVLLPSRVARASWSSTSTPVHASWLNQCEIYFSIVQRQALQPNNFADLDELERHLLAFGRRYEQIAKPFEWKFTRQDLGQVLDRLDQAPQARPTQQAA